MPRGPGTILNAGREDAVSIVPVSRVDPADACQLGDQEVAPGVVGDVVRAVELGIHRRPAVAAGRLGAVAGQPTPDAGAEVDAIDPALDRRDREVAAGRVDRDAGRGRDPRDGGDDPAPVDAPHPALVDVAEVEVSGAVEDELGRLGESRARGGPPSPDVPGLPVPARTVRRRVARS